MNELKPRQPQRLLAELARLSARVSAGEPLEYPRVTLHLTSGRDLSGWLLDVADDAGMGVALLRLEHRDMADISVAHVPISAVQALTVQAATRLEQPTAALPQVTRLALRRSMSAMVARLHALGTTLEIILPDEPSEADLEPLHSALQPLEQALSAILSDESGRQALAAISSLRLAVGDEPGVDVSLSDCHVRVARRLGRRLTATQWQERLERVL